MRRLIFIIIIIAIASFILVPQVAFIVDETESVIITRFGEFKVAYKTPGVRIKTPFVDTVTKFDKRLLRIDAPPTSILTKDKRNLVIDAYARYIYVWKCTSFSYWYISRVCWYVDIQVLDIFVHDYLCFSYIYTYIYIYLPTSYTRLYG